MRSQRIPPRSQGRLLRRLFHGAAWPDSGAVFLSIYNTVMTLPFPGMYFGLHEWTATVFGFGARTIAIVDTMADSPLGRVAMIPMLAWIAREAPDNRKATYFAVMAVFTNLALSANNLGTQYLISIFVIERGQ